MPFILKDKNGNLLKDKNGNVLGSNNLIKGFKLNGSDDQFSIALVDYLKLYANYSFSIAIQFTVLSEPAANKALFGARIPANGFGWNAAFNNSGQVYIAMGMNSTNRVVKIFNGAYRVGINNLLFTKDVSKSSTSFKTYLNNVEITDFTVSSNTLTSELAYTSINNLKVGFDEAAAGRTPDMFIWDFKIYRKLLTSVERANLFLSDNRRVASSNIIRDKTGNITSTAASTSVTGSGTSFTTECNVGEALFSSTGNFIGNILTINSNTSITLDSPALISHSGAFKHGSLVLDIRFDEKSGNTANDSSGLGLNLTRAGSSSTTLGASNAWREAITHNPYLS